VPELPDVKVITENISKIILYHSIKDIHKVSGDGLSTPWVYYRTRGQITTCPFVLFFLLL